MDWDHDVVSFVPDSMFQIPHGRHLLRHHNRSWHVSLFVFPSLTVAVCYLHCNYGRSEGSTYLLKCACGSLFFGFVAAQTGNEKRDITLRTVLGAAGPPPGLSLIQISYISAVFGLSLATNAFVWYRVSGGMFNPAVDSPSSSTADSQRCPVYAVRRFTMSSSVC